MRHRVRLGFAFSIVAIVLAAFVSLDALATTPAVAYVPSTSPGSAGPYEQSDTVIAGEVIELTSYWDAARARIFTDVGIHVVQAVKGGNTPDVIHLKVSGGEVGEIGEWAFNSPRFYKGEDVLLYLKQSDGALQLHGGIAGKVSLPEGAARSMGLRELEDIASGDGAALSLSDVVTPSYLYSGHKWPGASPTVSYRVNPNTPDSSGEEGAVKAAAATWTAVKGKNFALSYAGSTSATASSLNGTNEVMWRNLGAVDTLAVATHWYWITTGLIVEADIEFNEYYSWAAGAYDIQSVALHELGHWLNLKDLYNSSDAAKVMYGYYSRGSIKRALHSDDIAGIRHIYPATASITLTSPNGGESWSTGSVHDITWTSSGLFGTVKIEISRDGGASFSTIVAATPDDGIHPWTVTGPATASGRIRVTGTGSSTVSDVSDANFTITGPPPPSLAITSPNGGESWAVGSTQTITWTASGFGTKDKVKVELSRDGGTKWSTIAPAVTATSGSTTWKVSGTATANALVRVSNPLASDVSNAEFTITGPPPPSITVTSPDGGETWESATTQTITWTSASLTGAVKIELSRDGGATWSTIVPATPNTGSKTWKVSGTATTQARVRVSSLTSKSIMDSSNTDFTITGPPPPTIAVTSPNGGESWAVGSTQTITWTSAGFGMRDRVKVELSRDGGSTWSTIVPSVAATAGSAKWKVSGATTTHALVRISNPSVSDVSNAEFTIAPAITMTSPNGGESWAVGSTQSITWSAANSVSGNVTVWISRNGGTSWTKLGTAAASSGTYSWVVTGPASSTARVKVVSASNPLLLDVSDANFSITAP
ncbi:MAG: matrixin family metalloprotease [Chloroflexi bacterium]|nr:matrixin family metalloprotease [Chloroflexota bacterium]